MREVRTKSKSLDEEVEAIEQPERAAVRAQVRESNDLYTRLEVQTAEEMMGKVREKVEREQSTREEETRRE